jgi:hypothetical protein
MRRETRLLAALGVIALVGTGALSYLARQYERRAVSGPQLREAPESRAAHLVSGFLAVGGGEAPSDEALAGAAISREEYALVRRAALAWRDAGPVEDAALRGALEARAGEIRTVLGR